MIHPFILTLLYHRKKLSMSLEGIFGHNLFISKTSRGSLFSLAILYFFRTVCGKNFTRLILILDEKSDFLYSFPTRYEIMTKCWKVEAKERPTFEEIQESLNNMLNDGEVNKRI